MDKIDILGKYRFYTDANPQFQHELEEAAYQLNLNAGEPYFFEGDACTKIALLGEGRLRVYKQDESGREITLYHVVPGEACILSASCVLTEMSYPASACAELDSQALIFPAIAFKQWVASRESIRQFVFETVALRMTNIMSVVEEVTFKRMDRRLIQYLQQKFTNSGRPVRLIHSTHEQIASELGSAREVISRLLKDLERAGAIELTRGKISLKDSEVLDKQITTS